MAVVTQGVAPPGATVILSTNTTTNWKNGECTGHAGAAGLAGDTLLVSVVILKNAGPATCTISGFFNDAGSAANIVLTGLTTGDQQYTFGTVNNAGPLVITSSVASMVVVTAGLPPGG